MRAISRRDETSADIEVLVRLESKRVSQELRELVGVILRAGQDV